MGLFTKKECSICGSESGFLMNQALLDGNVCKDCRKDFSPFFTANEQTPVSLVKEHLEYRKENRKELAQFSPNRNKTIGRDVLLYIDENSGKYAFATKEDIDKGEPDVLNLVDYVSASYVVKESEHIDREDRSKDHFYYDFSLVIKQRSRTLPEITVKINSSSVRIDKHPMKLEMADTLYHGGKVHFDGLTEYDKQNLDTYMGFYTALQEMLKALTDYSARFKLRPGNILKNILRPGAAPARPAGESSSQTAPKFCPNCGTAVVPGSKFCTQCGNRF